MIISDLQYIENVDNSEVQGGSYWKKYSAYYTGAKADANADATAVGNYYTNAYTNTSVVADSDNGVSLSSSKSYAEASTKKYYSYSHH